MHTDSNLLFINNRITEIGSALMYSMSNGLVKIPCSIITVLNADESGHLWFFTNRPSQFLAQQEKLFPARLKFYRKGKPFFVDVSGQAMITEDKELINEFAGMQGKDTDTAMQNLVLIRLKINKAEYHEPKPVQNSNNFLLQVREIFMSLFKPAYQYRTFEMQPEMI